MLTGRAGSGTGKGARRIGKGATVVVAEAAGSQAIDPSGQLSAHPSISWGSRRFDPVTRLRSESAIAANVIPPHHRQIPPEERGMKQNKGRICRNSHIR